MIKLKAAAAALLLTTAAHAARPGDFLVSQFAAHEGDTALAASSMMQALAGDPASQQLREDAFVLSLLAGNGQAGRLAKNLPDNPLAQLLLATRAAHEGNWQTAELGYAELPHQSLSDLLRPLLVAWAQQAQGLPDRAMDTLQPALANTNLGAIAPLEAALIADAAHRDGLAQRLYEDLAKTQSRPSLQFARILANWQARGGDMAAAHATIEAAVKAAPDLAIAEPRLLAALDNPSPPNALRGIAQLLVEVAAANGTDDKNGLGELLSRVALAAQPGFADAHLLASEIATGHHQLKLAAAELEKVAQSEPLYPVVQLRLANIYARIGRSDDAVRLLRAMAAAYPERPEPLAQLGDTLADQKHDDAAIDAYDRAIALLRHPTPADWELFYARGSVLERAHQWPRAEADMNRALELSPDQPFVLNFLGYSMAERGENLKLAREMIEKALHARPNDGAIIDSLGWVALRQGNAREALHLLEKAAEMQPEDPSITGHLGDAYWELGRKLEAEDQWRRALVLKPDADEQARIEARLKSAAR
jgi:tetratricopeptide (TPR) repeat protein